MPAGDPSRDGAPDSTDGDALHRGVELAARLLLGTPRCLARAMVLERLARARHLAPALKFAIDPVAATLDAHAWVEIDGQAYGAVARYSKHLDRRGEPTALPVPQPAQSARESQS